MFHEMSAELLRRGNSICFRADGQSMQPTIRPGEVITVEPVVPSQIKRGDIVLYRAATGIIAHRVVRIKRKRRSTQSSLLSPHSSFVLRGDASRACDEPVAAGQVLGKVIAVERDGRSMVLDRKRAKIMSKGRLWASRLTRWMLRLD